MKTEHTSWASWATTLKGIVEGDKVLWILSVEKSRNWGLKALIPDWIELEIWCWIVACEDLI